MSTGDQYPTVDQMLAGERRARARAADEYLATIARLEPDVVSIDPGAFYSSAAISLKRMADSAERQAKSAEQVAKTLAEMLARSK